MNLLRTLSADVLACRSMGHAWYHRDDSEHRTTRRGEIVSFVRHEECERCGTERKRTVDLGASLISRRSMKYPPGYLLPGHPRTTRFDALEASYKKESDR